MPRSTFVLLTTFGALLVVRLIYWSLASEAHLVTIIPDDSFYYLQLAKNFHAHGWWTFDSRSPATGFHLLHAYFLVALRSIGIERTETYFVVSGSLGVLSVWLSALFTARIAHKEFRGLAASFALVPFFSPVVVEQSTSLMESAWTTLLSVLMLKVLTSRAVRSIPWTAAQAFLVGVAGSLCRSDLGLIAGVWFFVLGFGAYRGVVPKRRLLVSAALLIGAAVGVAFVVGHTYAISGQPFQGSAQIKHHWSSVLGHTPVAALRLVVAPFFLRPFLLSGLLVCLLSAFVVLVLRGVGVSSISGRLRNLPRFTLAGCSLTLLAYVAVYTFNSRSLQGWYVAQLIATLALLFSGTLSCIVDDRRAPLLIGVPFLLASVLSLPQSHWPAHAAMRNAGLELRSRPANETYGTWNAGLIGFYSQRNVVNLDGLVNDEVVPFIKADRLPCYLLHRSLTHVVDYAAMLATDHLKARGGYTDGSLEHCLVPTQRLDEGYPGWGESQLTLFEIDRVCLEGRWPQ